MDQRPVLTVPGMIATAIYAVIVAAITVTVAASIARDPAALWRPLLIGVGLFSPRPHRIVAGDTHAARA